MRLSTRLPMRFWLSPSVLLFLLTPAVGAGSAWQDHREAIGEPAGTLPFFSPLALSATGLCRTPDSPLQDERPEPSPSVVLDPDKLPARIAFGSCGHQDKPQPILRTVCQQQPDLFIYLGDNIYGDTKDMQVLKEKYQTLAAKSEFQELRQAVPLLSVWDDHDYGWNDAGKEYEFAEQSKAIFMDFWRVPEDSPRRQHAGIYGVHRFQDQQHSLQVILLDTRTFRDPLKRNAAKDRESGSFKNDYQPDPDETKTLLGDAQWQWLQQVLQEPADLRIVCSSIQFGHEYNGWESWTNLPLEQQRMVDLIRRTQANGVIFISGDVHWGEISRRDWPDLYPLYDVTASGLTEEWYNVEPNRYRQGDAVRENHFGSIDIDWTQSDPVIRLGIIDTAGNKRVEQRVRLSELQFPR